MVAADSCDAMVEEGNNDCMYYGSNFKRLGLYSVNWKIRVR